MEKTTRRNTVIDATDSAPGPKPLHPVSRWLLYGLGFVAAAVAVFLFFAPGLPRGTSKEAHPAPLTEKPIYADATNAPQPGSASEPAFEPEPGSVPAPTPEREVNTLAADGLKEVPTYEYEWQGCRCLIPLGFEPEYEWDTELSTCSLNGATQDLKQLIYHFEWEYYVIGWDDDVFSEDHIDVLFDSLGWVEYPKNGLIGHSVRTVANGVNCYHLYDTEYNVYYCFAQVARDGENVLLMQGLSKTEAGIDTFDSVVNAFVASLNGLELLVPPNASWSGSVRLVLNGEPLNTYTGVYYFEGSDAIIPLETFLCAIGGYPTESPYQSLVNVRHRASCCELCGKRYLLDFWQKVFLSEDDLAALADGQASPGRGLSETKIKSINLFPNVARGGETLIWGQAEMLVDCRTLEAVLRASGLDIAIACDADKQEIRVTLNAPDTIAVPDDPQRPALALFGKNWCGFACLFPKTAQIIYANDAYIRATDEALLQWDTEALKTVGLIDLAYIRVPEQTLADKTLSQWFFASEWREDDERQFEQPRTSEIAPDMTATYLPLISGKYTICLVEQPRTSEIAPDMTATYLPLISGKYTICLVEQPRTSEIAPDMTATCLPLISGKYTICLVKLWTDGDDALILLAEAWTEDALADFESIARRFSAMHAPDKTAEAVLGNWRLKSMTSADEAQSDWVAQVNEQIEEGTYERRYVFRADRTLVEISNIDSVHSEEQYTYSVEGNTMSVDGEERSFHFDGDQMIVEEDGTVLYFERIEEEEQSNGRPANLREGRSGSFNPP